MSYILDALKKSEKEQKSNKINILSGEDALLTEPVDANSSLKRSVLLLTLSFVFLAILVVLAWFLFTIQSTNQSANQQSETNNTLGSDSVNPQGLMSPSNGANNPQSSANTQGVQESVNGQASSAASNNNSNNTQSIGLAASVKSNEEVLNKNNPASVDDEPIADEATSSSVDDSELIETGLPDAINQLQINVLSYAPIANRRFVMISSKSYKEGASIDVDGESSNIVEIRQDGIVIDYQGNLYLKRP